METSLKELSRKAFAQTAPSFAQSDETLAGKVNSGSAGARLSSPVLHGQNDDGTETQRRDFHY
jgi:hypothetical protein